MKNFLKEFSAFALKGNVMDMAVGVIIGGAFSSIITALIENIINPIIGIAFQTDFSNVVIHAGAVEIGIGAFISAVINFLLMALVLFCIVRSVNKARTLAESLKKKEEEKPAEPAAPVVTTESLLAEILTELKKN